MTDLQENELQENVIGFGIHKGNTKFSMSCVEVDDIFNCKPHTRVYDNYMFSLKEEEYDNGELADIGYPYHYDAEAIVSEDHFMETGHVVGIDCFCYECDKVITK